MNPEKEQECKKRFQAYKQASSKKSREILDQQAAWYRLFRNGYSIFEVGTGKALQGEVWLKLFQTIVDSASPQLFEMPDGSRQLACWEPTSSKNKIILKPRHPGDAKHIRADSYLQLWREASLRSGIAIPREATINGQTLAVNSTILRSYASAAQNGGGNGGVTRGTSKKRAAADAAPSSRRRPPPPPQQQQQQDEAPWKPNAAYWLGWEDDEGDKSQPRHSLRRRRTLERTRTEEGVGKKKQSPTPAMYVSAPGATPCPLFSLQQHAPFDVFSEQQQQEEEEEQEEGKNGTEEEAPYAMLRSQLLSFLQVPTNIDQRIDSRVAGHLVRHSAMMQRSIEQGVISGLRSAIQPAVDEAVHKAMKEVHVIVSRKLYEALREVDLPGMVASVVEEKVKTILDDVSRAQVQEDDQEQEQEEQAAEVAMEIMMMAAAVEEENGNENGKREQVKDGK